MQGSVRFFRTEQKRRERQLEVSSKFIGNFHIIWRRCLLAPTSALPLQLKIYNL